MTNHHELAAAYLDRLEMCGVPVDELTASARSSELLRARLQRPGLAEFVAEHRLAYLDVVGGLVDTLRAECGIPDGVRPLVAIADWPASFVDLEPQLRHSAGLLSRFNLEAVPCHVG